MAKPDDIETIVLEEAPSGASPAPPPTDALLDEVSLLRRARAAIQAGDAARALSVTREHTKRHPAGALSEENLAIRIRSLCALGRLGQARHALRQLEHRAPRSPYLERVRRACPGLSNN